MNIWNLNSKLFTLILRQSLCSVKLCRFFLSDLYIVLDIFSYSDRVGIEVLHPCQLLWYRICLQNVQTVIKGSFFWSYQNVILLTPPRWIYNLSCKNFLLWRKALLWPLLNCLAHLRTRWLSPYVLRKRALNKAFSYV